MMTITIVTFVTTMMLLTTADSLMPRMSRSVSASRMNSAGTFMMPCTPFTLSNGEWHHSYGTCQPIAQSSTLLKYWLHTMETVAAPTAYSSTRSQPMIHARSSPLVADGYVDA